MITASLAGCAAPQAPPPEDGGATPDGEEQAPSSSEGGQDEEASGPVTEPWTPWDLDTPVEDDEGTTFMIEGYTYRFLDASGIDTEDEERQAWSLAATYAGTAERTLRAVQHAYGDVKSDRETVTFTLPDLHRIDHELTVQTDTRDRLPSGTVTVQVYMDDHPPIDEEVAIWSPGLPFHRFAVTSAEPEAVWEFGMNASMQQAREDAEAMYAAFIEGDDDVDEGWVHDTLVDFYTLVLHGTTIQHGLYTAEPVLYERTEVTVELGGTSFQAYNLTLNQPGGGYRSLVIAPALPMPVLMHGQGDDDRPVRTHWELTELDLTAT